MGPIYEEWRIVTRLLAETDAVDEIVNEVWAATPDGTDVHSRGRDEILLYAFSRKEALSGQAKLKRALGREAIPFDSTLTRWNPDGECWQDPQLPVGPPPYRIEPEWTNLGELGWEVRAKTQGPSDTRRLEDLVKQDDRPVFTDGWKRVTIGVIDEDQATRLIDELRPASPLTQFEKRPLTRFRRWQIRQALLGNYGGHPG
jgi:hypothetical protein